MDLAQSLAQDRARAEDRDRLHRSCALQKLADRQQAADHRLRPVLDAEGRPPRGRQPFGRACVRFPDRRDEADRRASPGPGMRGTAGHLSQQVGFRRVAMVIDDPPDGVSNPQVALVDLLGRSEAGQLNHAFAPRRHVQRFSKVVRLVGLSPRTTGCCRCRRNDWPVRGHARVLLRNGNACDIRRAPFAAGLGPRGAGWGRCGPEDWPGC
mmetsp:Transcript_41784/g.121212  ORF Transcript_41784/g.121212 Transcript_41784/m.121212 type:complete len:210 (+) Transcript_41784:172-801(+)